MHSVLLSETRSATDNLLIFVEPTTNESEPLRYDIVSGGNFHGQPVALALDFAGIATAELANISERRIEQLVNPHLSSDRPPLIRESGLNSGYMIGQVTAAALVSENKILAHPASVDSDSVVGGSRRSRLDGRSRGGQAPAHRRKRPYRAGD